MIFLWITFCMIPIVFLDEKAKLGGCDGRAKRGREELPHVRGQGQKSRGPHAWRAEAKRSYPTSEVRGGAREEIPSVRGQGQQWEELPTVWGQGRQPGGDTLRP